MDEQFFSIMHLAHVCIMYQHLFMCSSLYLSIIHHVSIYLEAPPHFLRMGWAWYKCRNVVQGSRLLALTVPVKAGTPVLPGKQTKPNLMRGWPELYLVSSLMALAYWRRHNENNTIFWENEGGPGLTRVTALLIEASDVCGGSKVQLGREQE